MQYRVKIVNESFKEVISNDIWYGSSLDNVKFWIDLKIKALIEELKYTKLSYEVVSID